MVMTIEFWKSSGEAAIKAAAAAALGVIGTDQLVSALGVDWSQVLGIALLAGIISILTSIVVPTPEVRAARREADRLEIAQSQILERYVKTQIMTPNEAREALGMPQRSDGDDPFEMTSRQEAEALEAADKKPARKTPKKA